MKRPHLTATFVLLLSFCNAILHAQPAYPNIIIILVDDGRYDEYRMTGAPNWFVAPSIERIANEGANFKRTYVPTAMCAPSRASMYTGVYGHQHGATNNNTDFNHDLPTIQNLLHEQGYYTGFIGKYGQGFNSPNEFDYWVDLETENYVNVTYKVNGVDTLIMGHTTDILGAFVDAFMDSTLAHPDQPFALFYFPLVPHPPATPRIPDKHIYDGMTVNFPTPFDSFPSLYPQYYYEGTSNWVKDSISTVQFIRDRFSCLFGLDYYIGSLFHFLDYHGITDNTFIAYTSDNGYMYGEHMMRAKVFPIEQSIHIPLFVRYPAWFPPNTVIDNDLSEIIDIPKSVLEVAGIPDTMGFEGISLHALAAPDTLRHYVRYEYVGDDDGPGGFNVPGLRGVRSFNYMYARANCDCFTEEFYDFLTDPLQTTNHILDAAYQPLINNYRSILDSLMLAVGDTLPLQSRDCAMPGTYEIADGYDQDCDGLVDDSIPQWWYKDADGDLFGVPTDSVYGIGPFVGYAPNDLDCNDGNASINPAMPDYCDHIDNDCDGLIDEDEVIPVVSPAGPVEFCAGTSETLTIPPVPPGFSIKWYKSDIYIYGATTTTLNITESGDYKVKLKAPANCTTESAVTVATKLPNPKPKIRNYTGTINLAITTPIKLGTKYVPGYTYQWYWYGSPLFGANDHLLFVFFPGFYKVRVTDLNGCSGFSYDYWIINVLKESGPDDYIDGATVNVYPNPASDVCTVTVVSDQQVNETGSVRITNLTGQLVMEIPCAMADGKMMQQIQLPATLSAGMYMLEIRLGQQSWKQQLVITR